MWLPTYMVNVSVVYSSEFVVEVDELLVDEREQEVLRLLRERLGPNATNMTFDLNVTYTLLPAPSRRRLYFVENEPFNLDACLNGTRVIVTVHLRTDIELVEDQLISALYLTAGRTLTAGNGEVLTACSNAVIHSERAQQLAPRPPSAPPPPYLSVDQIERSGQLLVLLSVSIIFFCGCCGQRLLVPSLRRRTTENAREKPEIGQPLLAEGGVREGVGRWWAGMEGV